MPAQSFPTAFVAEFRGVAPGGEFTDDDGLQVVYGPKVKLERASDEGDVNVYELRVNAKVAAASTVKPAELKRGDSVEVHGEAVVNDEPGRRSYFRLLAL